MQASAVLFAASGLSPGALSPVYGVVVKKLLVGGGM